MNSLQFSPTHNRLLRQDAPTLLGKPTRSFLEEALREGNAAEAARWLDYYLLEMTMIRQLFAAADWDSARYYLDRKGDEAWGPLLQESMAPWLGTTAGLPGAPTAEVCVQGRDARLFVLGLPYALHILEGDRRFDVTLDSPQEQEKRWAEWRAAIDAAIRAADGAEAGRVLDLLVAEARLLHDVLCDWEWALLTAMARVWGEAVLEDVLLVTQRILVDDRYEKIREMSVEDYLRLKAEEMRGHFTGAGRAGQFSLVEESDRYLLSFDACGTGGRMRRGDPLAGSGSRLLPPYNFLTIEGAYPWTWNGKGVCGYCAHCSVVNQIRAIETLGHPLRMTLYPDDANEPCRWIIYKQPSNYPDEAYAIVGKSR